MIGQIEIWQIGVSKEINVLQNTTFNTLTANYEYSGSNRENLPLPIQIQLFEKLKVFCCIFIAFLESTLSFERFEKNESPSLSVSEIIDSKKRAYSNASKVLFLKTIWQWTC